MTPDIPEPNHTMCFPWKLCSEGQQIPLLLHCFTDVCHWSETKVSISASLLKLCLNAFQQQLPSESDFSFFVLFPPFSSGAKQLSNVYSWEKQEIRVTGKRGRIPLARLEMSACVLLLLIILAPAEQMERERSLLGAILRELAGKGVRNHMNCAWGAQLWGSEREKKT